MKRPFLALISSLALVVSLSAIAAGGVEEVSAKDADYDAGVAAAAKKDWQQVITRMSAYTQRKPGDANGWNELGHAQRQLGRLEAALSAYATALKIDPKHKGAHEYLGEAYLQMGDPGRAEQELKALDSICFLPCEQYTDLKSAIARYKSERAKTGSKIPG